jgi:hypothetical protein
MTFRLEADRTYTNEVTMGNLAAPDNILTLVVQSLTH